MVGIYEVGVEILSILVGLSVVVVCLRRALFVRYLTLNFYLLASASFSVGCNYVRTLYGYGSNEYYYFYYTGDAVPNIVGFLLIGSFFDRLLRQSVFHKYVRPTLACLFLLVAGVSALSVANNDHIFDTGFVVEFQQNLYFVGVLLTSLLWISIRYLDIQNRRFTLLVSGLGIYFATHAASYALMALSPGLASIAVKIPPLAYTFMVGLWLYAFLNVPEEETEAGPPPPLVRRSASVEAHSFSK